MANDSNHSGIEAWNSTVSEPAELALIFEEQLCFQVGRILKCFRMILFGWNFICLPLLIFLCALALLVGALLNGLARLCGCGLCRCRKKELIKIAGERKMRRLPKGKRSEWKHLVFLYLLAWGHAEGSLGQPLNETCPSEISENLVYQPVTMRDDSRELHDLFARVQRTMAMENMRARDIIETYTVVRQERDLWLEVEAMSRQRDDNSVTVTMYALQQAHLATRTRRVALNRAGGLWHFIHCLRNVWNDLVPFDMLTEFIMMVRQLPPHMTGGEDILHLIFDTQPWRQSIPYAVLSFMQYEGPIDHRHFEIKAARGSRTMPCDAHFDVHGYYEFCQRQFVRCRCDEDTNFDVRPGQDTEVFLGKRIDILVEMDSFDNAGDDDLMSFMEMPQWPRHLGRYFVYTADRDEPVILQNFAEILTHLNVHQQIIHQFCEFTECRHTDDLAVHPVVPQPSNLAAFRAVGFVLVNELDRQPFESLIVADIDILTNHIPARVAQRYARAAWRETRFVRSPQTRRNFLILMGLQQFCLGPEDRCIVRHRGILWPSDERGARRFLDGDFALIQVLRRNNEVPFHIQWSWAEEGCNFEDFANRWATQNAGASVGQQSQMETQGENDTNSLLSINSWQVRRSRPSDAAEAMSKLPPPGNGKTVRFSEVVDTYSSEGLQRKQVDKAILNEFIAGMCEGCKEKAKENEFMENFVQGLRFKQQKEDTSSDTAMHDGSGNECTMEDEKDAKEDGNVGNLPIAVNLENELSETFNVFGKHEDRPQEAGVDFRDVFALRTWLEQHCVIPCFDISTQPWKRTSWEWLNGPIWQLSRAEKLVFYLDGAVKDGVMGASSVLFVCSGDVWHFGGFLSQSFDVPGSSFTAEMYAQLISIKWCWDLLRSMKFLGYNLPSVTFMFDCTAAGYLAEGTWKGDDLDPLFVTIRALHHAVQTALGVEIDMEHIKGHSNDPGNEAADVLAKEAANEAKRGEAFWSFLTDPNLVIFVQWLWLTYREDFAQYLHDGFWHIPKPQATVNPQVLAELEATSVLPDIDQPLCWTLRLASQNIMAIGAGDGNKRRTGPGFLNAFFRQMVNEEVHCFCLQETRLKIPPGNRHPDFFFFHAPPLHDGSGGMLIGFSRRIPYAVVDGQERSIEEADVTLIHRDAQLMLLKVSTFLHNFILISGHAPHSGRDECEILQWWQSVSERIPGRLKQMDKVFCGDVNGRVGSILTRAVGHWQAEQENVGGQTFHDFILREGCWLPATHEEHQYGPGWSWCHPLGHTSRIDYAALPESWKGFKVKTWMQRDRCINCLLHDHSMTRVTIEGWNELKRNRAQKGQRSMKLLDLKDTEGVNRLETELTSLGATSWEVDVHTQVHDLQREIKKQATNCLRAKPRLKKDYLQEDTLSMIGRKRAAKQLFFWQKEEVRWWRLKEVFAI